VTAPTGGEVRIIKGQGQADKEKNMGNLMDGMERWVRDCEVFSYLPAWIRWYWMEAVLALADWAGHC